MSRTIVPTDYKPALSIYETQLAIEQIKRRVESGLELYLNLSRVSAPLFVDPASGLNDNLSGVERPVGFDIPDGGMTGEVVQSLAKWKRLALYEYDFAPGHGLFTDMDAIRRDEEMDNLHSIYVDQWDWEKVILPEERTLERLQNAAQAVVNTLCDALIWLKERHPALDVRLSRNVAFITTQELEDLYPDMTSRERENAFVREHHTAFIMQIGCKLKSGKVHDGRAPDYDDWQLNGDLFMWHETLGCAIEMSSMGIRVDVAALERQLTLSGFEERRALPFHRLLLEGKLPLTMGGGIGQSRTCMLLMGKAHIGEVQVSLWDAETRRICKEAGIPLL
jgi:aspartate--ammonia ligase